MKHTKRNRLWKRCVIFLLVLCIVGSPIIPQMDFGEIQTGTMETQAATVYKRIDFQDGLFMPPRTSVSYEWLYMQKGDKVQYIVNSNGTLYVGFTRKSDKKMMGVERSNNFTVTATIPSTGYYRIFIINNSTRSVTLKGVAICSH